jgi:glycosyltransferase involved in cell wall biosynthesis
MTPTVAARRLLSAVRRLARPVTLEAPFGVGRLAVLNQRLSGWGLDELSRDPSSAERDVASAARYIVALLADAPRLWRRFPSALSAGPDGPFARWLTSGGAGVTPVGSANVRAAFEQNPGLPVRRIYELRPDLRDAFVLGLTPHQRAEYLTWLLTYGRDDFDVTPERALWYLGELGEDPSQGLVATYRAQPRWQAAVPHGLTRFGWNALRQWVALEYGIDQPWLRRAKLPNQFGAWDELQLLLAAKPELRASFPTAAVEVAKWVKANCRPDTDGKWLAKLAEEIRDGLPDRPGVNVIGLFRYTSGLQQAVRSAVASLTRCGVRTSLRDFPVAFLREPRDRTAYDGIELFDVTVLNTGIDFPAAGVYRLSGLHDRPGVHRVGIWWWEMETIPAGWRDRAEGVDEIWAPTTFIANAMQSAFDKPVFPMLPGLELPPFDPLPRSYFGLRDNRFVFAFVFDMNSRMQRKNPLGLIRAFRAAFRRDEPVELVIKVSPPESYYAELWEELRAAADDAGATLIDRVMTRPELLAFLNAADCYVSLHRSEGFGLTCAESMLLGKPVVATGYSGNLDFMTPENSFLVNYDRVTLEKDIDPYPKGAVWAEPRIEDAAGQMRRVYENREEALEKGLRAKQEVAQTLSLEAAGRRMAARLNAIRACKATSGRAAKWNN